MSLRPPFYRQVFSDLPGGKAYFYVGGSGSGTSIPKNVYADAARAHALPQPLVLDSIGQVPDYFMEPGEYFIAVYPAGSGPGLGSPGFTRDQVAPAGDEAGWMLDPTGPYILNQADEETPQTPGKIVLIEDAAEVAIESSAGPGPFGPKSVRLTGRGLQISNSGLAGTPPGTLPVDGVLLDVSGLHSGESSNTAVVVDRLSTRQVLNSKQLGTDANGMIIDKTALIESPLFQFTGFFPQNDPPDPTIVDRWYIAGTLPTGAWAGKADYVFHRLADDSGWESFAPFTGLVLNLGGNIYTYRVGDGWIETAYNSGFTYQFFQPDVRMGRLHAALIQQSSGDFRWDLGDTYGLRVGDSAGVAGQFDRAAQIQARSARDLAPTPNTITIVDVMGVLAAPPDVTLQAPFTQWLVGTGATGAWAGKDGQIACVNPANYPNPNYWYFFTISDGAIVRLTGALYKKMGGTLVALDNTRLRYSSTARFSRPNTLSQTTILGAGNGSRLLLANEAVPGTKIRFRTRFTAVPFGASVGHLYLKIGSQTWEQQYPVLGTGDTTTVGILEGEFCFHSVGATGKLYGLSSLVYGYPNALQVLTKCGDTETKVLNGLTINTTADNVLDIQVVPDNASTPIILLSATIEVVAP